MKRFVGITCIVLFLGLSGTAQRNKNAQVENPDETKKNEQYSTQEEIYKLAISYNDFEIATKALYEMMVLDPDNRSLKDSLALIYFTRGYYLECALVSKEIIDEFPANNTILEVLAMSEDALGFLKESLGHYELLYKNTGILFYQYQVISLQYKLKRYGECSLVIEQILANESVNDQKITMTYQKGTSQEIPMKAAVLNMKGVIALELANKDLAKKCFEEAIVLAPDFELPANNLALMTAEKKKE